MWSDVEDFDMRFPLLLNVMKPQKRRDERLSVDPGKLAAQV